MKKINYFRDLRSFLDYLEKNKLLKKISDSIDPNLEFTAISDLLIKSAGPCALFTNPVGSKIPALCNLFGTQERIAIAMNLDLPNGFRELGKALAEIKSPTPPDGIMDIISKFSTYKRIVSSRPKILTKGVCQEIIKIGNEVDLGEYPIQKCWPNDAGKMITWGLVVTKSILKNRQNIGIYRQQVIDKNRVIMRWLAHRGGAMDYAEWKDKYPNTKFPISVVIGADPVTILAAVAPIPNNLSETSFAGLLRGKKTELVKCRTNDLYVPAYAEIVLEGHIYPNDTALEGPFGDHTGYYNAQDYFPVFTIEAITHRENPIYHTTYMGRPTDEPSVLGAAFAEMVVPLLQKQFPEIIDFYLPKEACSYRFCVVSIKKRYLGHAKRIMLGIWSFLMQFSYIKFIVVVDDDINIMNFSDVMWAVSTRMDPARDTLVLENTPIDYLDFASPDVNLGGKIGLDATNKWPGETNRTWGRPIIMDAAVSKKAQEIIKKIFI